MKSNFMTARELEIFKRLVDNESTKDIADNLNISEKTVRNHISNVFGQGKNSLIRSFFMFL